MSVIVCIFPLLATFSTFAGYTALQALRSEIGDDHSWMMWATISVLSDAEREYLEPELELLICNYCRRCPCVSS